MINFWWQRSSGDAVVGGLSPIAWYRFQQGITITGSGVSQWSDQSGNGNHLLQATDSARPQRQIDGSILFDGAAFFLKCTAFTLNQPNTIYFLGQQVAWSANGSIWDGNAINQCRVFQAGSSPNLNLHAGSNVAGPTTFLVGIDAVLAVVYNGASSSWQVNSGAATTVNPSTANAAGFTLGANGSNGQFGNIKAKEIVIFPAAHTSDQRSAVISYLATVGGISI